MYWINFFHIYQPPNWPAKIIKKVASESYWPVFSWLEKNPRIKITLNISGSLTEQLAKHKLYNIISSIRSLAAKKQIELTGSAIYHPILPLLPTSEIVRQIKLNNLTNKKYFGQVYRPEGFFPPEMAYGKKVALAAQSLGFKWIIADEISKSGKLNTPGIDNCYKISNTKIKIIFRNREISDYFAFHGNPNRPKNFWQKVKKDRRNTKFLLTAMDGENLGHHRPGWDKFWFKLVSSKKVKTNTIGSILKKYSCKKTILPQRASWSSQENEISKGVPYILWNDPNNPIHQLQWRFLRHIANLVEENKKNKNYPKARKLLDKRLASDQFWWASAKPWWSLEIISKKTKELIVIADLIKKNDPLTKNLAKKIISTATSWQKEKTFQSIARNYLASNTTDQKEVFIGGTKITFKK